MSEHKPKHDGDLGGPIAEDARVEYASTIMHHRGDAILLSGGYGGMESESIELDAKQALSLLAWLFQEQETLERLAKEQDS